MTGGVRMPIRLLLCVTVLALSACGLTDMMDPYKREGMWRPNNANEDNLRAMVASPSDLVRGVSSNGSDGQQAAAALDRAREDKMRRLPDSALAKVTPVSSGSGTQGSQ
jgi:type IV pilus biogenesis protein CpaD/CtpE